MVAGGSCSDKEADMPVREGETKQLIAVIDDGTKTVRFVVYDTSNGKEVAYHQLDKSEVQPQEGWWEQDPKEILHHIHTCANVVLEKLCELGYTKEDIAALGVTNQRETTIAWDRFTGEPLHPAISWNDHRTNITVDAILAKIPDRNKNYLKPICGLPISPYFSALKMRWMLDNVESVRGTEGLCFTTVDSWIVWNLTGGRNGGLYITDVTNASRTLLMNLDTLNWDPMLLRIFGIDRKTLPDIRSSSEVYGVIKNGSVLDGITISGILGNQQSALVGQNCLKAGEAKSTFRSGCFLLYNTGKKRVDSTHGLVTTVAYQMGPGAEPCYALEGSIEVAGSAMKFLRDNLKIIKDVSTDTEKLGSEVISTGDVYFVPAFNGLFAPYWRKDARGIICGLTQFTTRQHIIRAAMEAVCFQTRDILEAMNKDCGLPLRSLNVDGKMTSNDLLMQLQADIIGIPVCRAESWDMSAVGAAVVAARGIQLLGHSQNPNRNTFYPTTRYQDRNARYTKWKMAVQRSLGWATTKKSFTMTGQHRKTSFPTLIKTNSTENPTHSRELSNDRISIDSIEQSDYQNAVDELSKYAARKFSVSINKSDDDRTILDDYNYFMSKQESDYGKQRNEIAPRVLNDWQSIEDIIVNDPEIIFDCDDNPIIVDPRSFDSSDCESMVLANDVGLAKMVNLSSSDGVKNEVSYNGVSGSNS